MAIRSAYDAKYILIEKEQRANCLAQAFNETNGRANMRGDYLKIPHQFDKGRAKNTIRVDGTHPLAFNKKQ